MNTGKTPLEHFHQRLGEVSLELDAFAQTQEARAFDLPLSGYETFFDDLRAQLQHLQRFLETFDMDGLRNFCERRMHFFRWTAEFGFADSPVGKQILDLVVFDLCKIVSHETSS